MRAVRPLALLLLFAAALVVTDRALTPPLARLFAETRVGIVAGQANLALAHRDADLLVFGSSRAVYQVDPDVLAARLGLSAQNAGNRGQGVRYARGLEALLLERGSRAKVFVLVLDFEDLWSEDSERLQALAPFWGESPVLDALLVQRGPFERLKLASGLYRYNSMLLPMLAHRLRPDPGADAANGFLPLPPRVGPLGRAGAPGGADPGPPVPDVLDAYRGFIRDARAAGKAVLFVTAPRWRPDGLSTKQVLGRRLLASLARAEGAAYVAIDQATCGDFEDPSLWWDVTHLDAEGARLYSSLLADAVAALLADDER
ncbi:MAG: hypothetical protein R3C71_11970 [Candidatus Krumholzibacteriia bacterium]